MYPFERFLRTLKCKIKNPRYVEGSIAEAFLVEEATKFASYYYPPEVISRWRGYLATMMVVYRVVDINIQLSRRVVGKHCSSTLEGIDKKVAECSSNTPAWGTVDPATGKLWIRPVGTTEFHPLSIDAEL
ncbi:hypothetical protein K1719_034298 [Acacia pycnantha]|nr:hypothetical protein K1719_034298 [Acacia pycnantha]